MNKKIAALLILASLMICACTYHDKKNVQESKQTGSNLIQTSNVVKGHEDKEQEIVSVWKGAGNIEKLILLKRKEKWIMITKYLNTSKLDLQDESIGAEVKTMDYKEYYYIDDPHYGFIILLNGDLKTIDPNNSTTYKKHKIINNK